MRGMETYKSGEEERRNFFDTRTPEDPAYYSPRILEFYDYHTGEMLTKRGKEIMKRLRDMDWKEVLREYLRNWIKGMQMLHVVSTDFNTGNSSPAQYGWYPNSYVSVAFDKLRQMVIDGHPTLSDGHKSEPFWVPGLLEAMNRRKISASGACKIIDKVVSDNRKHYKETLAEAEKWFNECVKLKKKRK